MSFIEIFAYCLLLIIVLNIIRLGLTKESASVPLISPTVTYETEEYEPNSKEAASFHKHNSKNCTNVRVDLEGLKDWYLKEIKKHQKNLRSQIKWFKISCCLSAISCAIGITVIPDLAFSVTAFISLVMYGIMGSMYYNISSNKIEEEINHTAYLKLNRQQFPNIWAMCDSIMTSMNIDPHTLEIYYVKNSAFEAHVRLEDNTIYLFLSRGAVSHANVNSIELKSVLGHEFGHVLQRDTKMLLANKRLITIPGIISIAMLLFCYLSVFFNLRAFSAPEYFQSLWMTILFLNMLNKRQDAEYLADTASKVFVENSVMEDVIEKYVPQKGTLSYPSKKERLEQLKQNIERFTSTEQFITTTIESKNKVVA